MSSLVGRSGAVVVVAASDVGALSAGSDADGGDVGGAVRGAAVRFSTSRGSFQSGLGANARQSRSRAPTAPESSPPSVGLPRPTALDPLSGRLRARRRDADSTARQRHRRRPTFPTASPARNAAPNIVASATGETSTGRRDRSASERTNVGLAAHAAVDAQRCDGQTRCRLRPPRRDRRRAGPRHRARPARCGRWSCRG